MKKTTPRVGGGTCEVMQVIEDIGLEQGGGCAHGLERICYFGGKHNSDAHGLGRKCGGKETKDYSKNLTLEIRVPFTEMRKTQKKAL